MKNSIRKFGIVGTLLVGLLTACPTPAPVVSSVVMTAPSSNAIKIGAATAFTAVAKDSSGTNIAGKTFCHSYRRS